ncbi:hypothetical protein LZ32DRAFT_142429 [Colletotrichum eremochloae]|nr:hypothetical protein LZ32DRAFT_142429 [Colletotrichum eremochloae]
MMIKAYLSLAISGIGCHAPGERLAKAFLWPVSEEGLTGSTLSKGPNGQSLPFVYLCGEGGGKEALGSRDWRRAGPGKEDADANALQACVFFPLPGVRMNNQRLHPR